MYGREKITLIDDCLNVAEEWASDKNTNYFSLPKNEMEKDLQKYLLLKRCVILIDINISRDPKHGLI